MAIPDPGYALVPSGNLRRRLVVSRLLQGGATTAAVLAVAVLGILVFYVTEKGIGALSWAFLTSSLPPPNGTGAGIGPAIVGTFEVVLIGTMIAVPVGVLTAVYVVEFAGPGPAQVIRLVLDLLTGLPTIIIGVVVFGLLVAGTGESAYAGGIALSIVEVPLIARASLEALRRVSEPLREAAAALGVSHWRTVVGVVLPSALNAIVTATILAVARAAGETAPLLLTTSLYGPLLQLNPGKPVPSIPLEIFSLSEAGYPGSATYAWGAAFVLLAGILLANIGARMLVGRSRRRSGG
jgi:phosphate transport system permease protein